MPFLSKYKNALTLAIAHPSLLILGAWLVLNAPAPLRYTAFNAVTHLVDHDASEKQKERGWSSVGRGQAIKDRAFNMLLS